MGSEVTAFKCARNLNFNLLILRHKRRISILSCLSDFVTCSTRFNDSERGVLFSALNIVGRKISKY